MDDAMPCGLCGRPFSRRQLTKHHCLPRERGGTQEDVELLCPQCHGMVHATYTNRTLAALYPTLAQLRRAPELGKFLRWVRKQPPSRRTWNEPSTSQPAPASCMHPSTSRKPGLLGRAWGRARAGVQRAGCALRAGAQRVRQGMATAWGSLALLKPIRSQILTALGVGAAAGVAVYFAGPWVAAASGWLAGVLSTVAVQAGIALRRTLLATELTP